MIFRNFLHRKIKNDYAYQRQYHLEDANGHIYISGNYPLEYVDYHRIHREPVPVDIASQEGKSVSRNVVIGIKGIVDV